MADTPSFLRPNQDFGMAPANAAPPAQMAPQGPNAPIDLSGGAESSQVLDPSTGKIINIPHDNLEVAIRSGQYKALPNVNYGAKDKHGIFADVDGADLPAFLAGNATIAPAAETAHHRNQEKYGNSELTAGLEGAERGFLPGISDRLLTGSKTFNGTVITKEDLVGRADANPISSGLGEAIGTTAALFSPAGKATVGAGTAAAAKTVAKLGAKAGLSSKVAQAIVSKILPAAAGSAVEGAYFGAAHLLNEDALGTAQFNAENLLSSVEQGALWGAALGGGLSALGSATSSTSAAIAETNAGKYLGGKISKATDSFSNSTKAAREFLGITDNRTMTLNKRDPGFMADALQFTKEALEENPRSTIVEVAAKAKSDI